MPEDTTILLLEHKFHTLYRRLEDLDSNSDVFDQIDKCFDENVTEKDYEAANKKLRDEIERIEDEKESDYNPHTDGDDADTDFNYTKI